MIDLLPELAPAGGDDAVSLGVDVGGTSMKAIILTPDGHRRAERRAITPAADGPAAVVAAIRSFVAEIRTAAGPAPVTGLGLVVPGVVDPAAGVARYAANLGWRDVPVADLVGDLDVPVRLDHDVRSAGRAEGAIGAARGHRDFLYLPIGTGIAAAMCVDGRFVAGPHGSAGELGHIPVYPDGDLCACGQRGCLETYASASAIARRYVAAGGPPTDAATIAGRLGTDPRADRVWTEAVDALGVALATYTLLNDPELIVIGGGLSLAGEMLMTPLRSALAARLAWVTPPQIVAGELGADAGVLGAALLGRAVVSS